MSSPDITENDNASHISGAADMPRASSPDTPDPRHLRAPLTHCPARSGSGPRGATPFGAPPSSDVGPRDRPRSRSRSRGRTDSGHGPVSSAADIASSDNLNARMNKMEQDLAMVVDLVKKLQK